MKNTAKAFIYWLAAFLLWETVLHTAVFPDMSRFLPAVGFSAAAAALTAALTGLPGRFGVKGVVSALLAWAVPAGLFLFYAVQLVYHDIFAALLSLAYVSQGGAALAAFWPIALAAIWHCLPRLLLLALPLVGFAILRTCRVLEKTRHILALVTASAAITALMVLSLPLMGGTGANTPYAAYHNATATVDRWADHFGVLTASVMDLHRLTAGRSDRLAAGGLDLTAGGGGVRNVLDEMDFSALDRATEDPGLLELDRYFSGLAGTGKNEYTGLFQGYNLIVVCAEAFSPYVIDPELTPTLYKMSREGIVFENFYNSFPSLTTDGEYGLCMGLMPDASRISFAASMDNYVPFCLGHVFADRHPYAYHNNISTFYNRINTHSNMGYDFKAIGFGLEMEPGDPASDREMMEKSVDDYIHSEPFHAYYMTFSGHAYYSFAGNDMSRKNQERVAHLTGSEGVLAYRACQLELEDAMTYLLDRLEAAGIAERTVVVLTGDHYPYGLEDADYAALAGEAAKEPFWKYRNSFICYTAGLEEPVTVPDYCCTQDILPTLLNLFGVSYDSRLLTGRDVLSGCTHAAVLKDGSILTDAFVYDGSSGSLTWRGESGDEEQAQAVIQAVTAQFSVAAAILDTDYYGFVFSTLDLAQDVQDHPDHASFADIGGTWYEEEVEYLSSRGALSGGGTGNFRGRDRVSRAELLTMLTRGFQLTGDGETPYADVEPDKWYALPISAALDAGWLTGEEESFRPQETATEAEAAVLLAAAARYAGLETEPDWVAETVRLAAARAGDTPEAMSRAAAAVSVAALLREVEALSQGSGAPAGPVTAMDG